MNTVIEIFLWTVVCCLTASGLAALCWVAFGGLNGKHYKLRTVPKPCIGQKVLFEPRGFEWQHQGVVVGFEMEGSDVRHVIVRRLFRYLVSPDCVWEVPTEADRHYRKVYTDISW